MGDPLQGFDLGTQRRRHRLRVPLTPLIDIIFLLVMFFLLSSTFSDLRVLRVGLTQTSLPGSQNAPGEAAGPSAPTERGPVFITVARMDGAGRAGAVRTEIRVDGLPVELEDLSAHLDRLAEEGATSAVVRARPGTNLQDIVSVLDQARGSELLEVGILAGR